MISMTPWKNWLQRMLLFDKLKLLVGQTPKVADFGPNSATGNAAAASEVDGGKMFQPHTPSEAVLRAHRTSYFLRFRKYGAKCAPSNGVDSGRGRIIR